MCPTINPLGMEVFNHVYLALPLLFLYVACVCFLSIPRHFSFYQDSNCENERSRKKRMKNSKKRLNRAHDDERKRENEQKLFATKISHVQKCKIPFKFTTEVERSRSKTPCIFYTCLTENRNAISKKCICLVRGAKEGEQLEGERIRNEKLCRVKSFWKGLNGSGRKKKKRKTNHRRLRRNDRQQNNFHSNICTKVNGNSVDE